MKIIVLKEISNIANAKINIRPKKFEDIYLATKDCTKTRTRKRKPKEKLEVLYPKKRKFFGKWIHSDKYELDIDKSKNSLLKKYPEILEKISYFSNNAPKFLSHAFMFVKNEVSTFGQKIINQSIINSEQYQLNRLDYEKFTKILSKEFNDRNMCKKLEDLFIEFQAKNERNLEKHNKKVIRYIRNNAIKELFANEYLDLTFYELFNLFIVYRLDDYIKGTEKVFDNISMEELYDLMPSNPKWMDGARSGAIIPLALFHIADIKWIIPSDLNLINGVINDLK